MTSAAAAGGRDWQRIALVLVGATMAYNLIEAAIALASGMAASSIALVGFGLDSIIECIAAVAVFWGLAVAASGADARRLERVERRGRRVVGATFVLLALYVTGQAGWMLWRRSAPDESLIGIVLTATSLVVMPLVSWGKLRAAREIGSAALRAEAKETLACSYLSCTVLLGLAANAAAGWWWADPAAALLMVPWLVKEGAENLGAESDCDAAGNNSDSGAGRRS